MCPKLPNFTSYQRQNFTFDLHQNHFVLNCWNKFKHKLNSTCQFKCIYIYVDNIQSDAVIWEFVQDTIELHTYNLLWNINREQQESLCRQKSLNLLLLYISLLSFIHCSNLGLCREYTVLICREYFYVAAYYCAFYLVISNNSTKKTKMGMGVYVCVCIYLWWEQKLKTE